MQGNGIPSLLRIETYLASVAIKETLVRLSRAGRPAVQRESDSARNHHSAFARSYRNSRNRRLLSALPRAEAAQIRVVVVTWRHQSFFVRMAALTAPNSVRQSLRSRM
jgi:hypothetical protein